MPQHGLQKKFHPKAPIVFNINSIQKRKNLICIPKVNCKEDPERNRIQSLWMRSGSGVGSFRLRPALPLTSTPNSELKYVRYGNRKCHLTSKIINIDFIVTFKYFKRQLNKNEITEVRNLTAKPSV